LGVRNSIQPVKYKFSDEMLAWLSNIWLERAANDLHMVQLMPLPLHHLLLRSNTDWFNLSGAGLPRLTWKRDRLIGYLSFTIIVLSVITYALPSIAGQ